MRVLFPIIAMVFGLMFTTCISAQVGCNGGLLEPVQVGVSDGPMGLALANVPGVLPENGLPRSTSAASAAAATAKTSTGFYYPVDTVYSNDQNWLACGSVNYYKDVRHIGSDLIKGIGTSVFSVGVGKILYKSGPNESSGWGIGNYALVIKHASSQGYFIAVYGHIQTTLKAGDLVGAGQKIGTVGRYQETVSGRIVDRTPHLHFGIFPSGSGFPSSNWGRVTDVGCARPNLTNGFVAPISWIRAKVPFTGPINW